MKVKICGITDLQSALAAVQLGADAIGFVFAESKRKIDMKAAKEIAEKLPESVMKVGVFVNETKKRIEQIASFTGLSHIQLHGEETPEFCRSIGYPVIKAISVQTENELSNLQDYPSEFILLDGPKGKYNGGNGTSFKWQEIKTEELDGKKIILAGGLDSDNVLEAIKLIKPYMVDVSSGVETDGKKDVKKIEKFIEHAKGKITRGILK